MAHPKLKNKQRYSIFFDFDNTITPFDVLDNIIERFSINNEWKKAEKEWKDGLIGSKECLRKQLSCVRISKNDLKRYLKRIKIDPNFSKILLLLKEKKIKPVILSDNFSFIINYILRNNGYFGIKLYSNKLKLSKNMLIPSFPHINNSCPRCGHCKRNNLLKNSFRDKIIYIGDGLSDICPAKASDIVFAKASLQKHFKKINKKHFAISNLSQVYTILKKIL